MAIRVKSSRRIIRSQKYTAQYLNGGGVSGVKRPEQQSPGGGGKIDGEKRIF